MLARPLLALCLIASPAVFAQAPLVQDAQPLEGRRNQKVERLHTEDSAVKIDEVRYAGQTESITVQPKDGLPAYELKPSTPGRQHVEDNRRGITSGGERVWNVFSF